jgi:hypothetical protein
MVMCDLSTDREKTKLLFKKIHGRMGKLLNYSFLPNIQHIEI